MLQISFIIPQFLTKPLHHAQFYSFYTASLITVLYSKFKLPIKVSYVSYLSYAS